MKCIGLSHVRKKARGDCGGRSFAKFTPIAAEATKEADGDSDDADSDEDEQEGDEESESDDAGVLVKKKSDSDEGSGDSAEDAGDSDGDDDDEDDDSSGGGGEKDDDDSDDDGDDDDSDNNTTTKQIANTKKREKNRELMAKACGFGEEWRGENLSMMPLYPGPRCMADLNAGALSRVGSAEPTREGAGLRALEHSEITGLLPKQ